MTYQITPEHMASISREEEAFSTERFLPSERDVPEEFKKGNVYTKIAEAIFYGGSFPKGRIEMKDGFSPSDMNKCVRAHLASWGPKHEHKISGVGYMISCACTFHPE